MEILTEKEINEIVEKICPHSEDESTDFDRFFDLYQDNKIEAILERWAAALNSMEQYIKCPESKTCLDIAESAIKYSRVIIDKIEELEKNV